MQPGVMQPLPPFDAALATVTEEANTTQPQRLVNGLCCGSVVTCTGTIMMGGRPNRVLQIQVHLSSRESLLPGVFSYSGPSV
eukprot:1086671-Rhodomonas_salina.1